MIRNFDRRLSTLEDQLGLVRRKPAHLLILLDAGTELRSTQEAEIDRLCAVGFFPGGGFSLVDPAKLPAESTPRGRPSVTITLAEAGR